METEAASEIFFKQKKKGKYKKVHISSTEYICCLSVLPTLQTPKILILIFQFHCCKISGSHNS
jgi:hypothetical protein